VQSAGLQPTAGRYANDHARTFALAGTLATGRARTPDTAKSSGSENGAPVKLDARLHGRVSPSI